MSKQSKWDYFKAIYSRYKTADTANKKAILDAFCRVGGFIENTPSANYPDCPSQGSHPQQKNTLQKFVRLKAVFLAWMPSIKKQDLPPNLSPAVFTRCHLAKTSYVQIRP
ncbi:MAG: hypothetical protein AAB035_00980 [Nitrospirota bacterium]